MLSRRDENVSPDGAKCKRMRIGEDNNRRPWSELPRDLVGLILKCLGVVEFLLFACVCRSWRSCAAACKQKFMANQPPLIFLMSSYARRFCYFYDIFDERLYRRTLPNLVGKTCIGFSCGYLIMEDKAYKRTKKQIPDSQLYLLNPFTGHELYFPSPPQSYCSVILASCTTPYPQFIVIAFSGMYLSLQFRRFGDDNWTVVDYDKRKSWIEDVAVFNGQVYVVTSDAKIGVLNLDPVPHVTMLELEGKIASRYFLHRPQLIASHGRLLMVDHQQSKRFRVFKLDFLQMKLKRKKSSGQNALFLGAYKCSGLSTIAKMKGKGQKGIYYLDIWTREYSLHPIMDGHVKWFPNTPKKGMPDISINIGTSHTWLSA